MTVISIARGSGVGVRVRTDPEAHPVEPPGVLCGGARGVKPRSALNVSMFLGTDRITSEMSAS